MKEILNTILDPGSQPADFAALPLPESYRAVTLHRDEEHHFLAGLHLRLLASLREAFGGHRAA